MQDIDRRLRRLAKDQVHGRLAATDAAVMDAIAGHVFPAPEPSFRFRFAAVGIALAMGIAGGMVTEGPAQAQQSHSLIGGDDLAPSALLTEGW